MNSIFGKSSATHTKKRGDKIKLVISGMKEGTWQPTLQTRKDDKGIPEKCMPKLGHPDQMDRFLERHKLLKLTQEIDIITNKLSELTNEFNNVAGYKINILKSVTVEYTNNFKMTKLPK